jgi:hypothetical protein
MTPRRLGRNSPGWKSAAAPHAQVPAFPFTKVLDALAILIENKGRALKRERRSANSWHQGGVFWRRMCRTSWEVMLEWTHLN